MSITRSANFRHDQFATSKVKTHHHLLTEDGLEKEWNLKTLCPLACEAREICERDQVV